MNRLTINPHFPIVDENGVMTRSFREQLLEFAALVPFTGTGSPEGVIEARQNSFYIDSSGSSGSIYYVKKQADISGDTSQGWVAV